MGRPTDHTALSQLSVFQSLNEGSRLAGSLRILPVPDLLEF